MDPFQHSKNRFLSRKLRPGNVELAESPITLKSLNYPPVKQSTAVGRCPKFGASRLDTQILGCVGYCR